jgi:hypothetical protein
MEEGDIEIFALTSLLQAEPLSLATSPCQFGIRAIGRRWLPVPSIDGMCDLGGGIATLGVAFQGEL